MVVDLIPDDQLLVQSLGDGLGQHGLSGARLALDEQGLLQYHGDVYCPEQLLIGHIILTSSKFLHGLIPSRPKGLCVLILWNCIIFFE